MKQHETREKKKKTLASDSAQAGLVAPAAPGDSLERTQWPLQALTKPLMWRI